ncbi:hypothetical protein HDU67_006357 [Dinochytrium kinnereticum]|nr:hypothetical protein HDU67_006357 [Dinochytrium kinnereticum]
MNGHDGTPKVRNARPWSDTAHQRGGANNQQSEASAASIRKVMTDGELPDYQDDEVAADVRTVESMESARESSPFDVAEDWLQRNFGIPRLNEEQKDLSEGSPTREEHHPPMSILEDQRDKRSRTQFSPGYSSSPELASAIRSSKSPAPERDLLVETVESRLRQPRKRVKVLDFSENKAMRHRRLKDWTDRVADHVKDEDAQQLLEILAHYFQGYEVFEPVMDMFINAKLDRMAKRWTLSTRQEVLADGFGEDWRFIQGRQYSAFMEYLMRTGSFGKHTLLQFKTAMIHFNSLMSVLQPNLIPLAFDDDAQEINQKIRADGDREIPAKAAEPEGLVSPKATAAAHSYEPQDCSMDTLDMSKVSESVTIDQRNMETYQGHASQQDYRQSACSESFLGTLSHATERNVPTARSLETNPNVVVTKMKEAASVAAEIQEAIRIQNYKLSQQMGLIDDLTLMLNMEVVIGEVLAKEKEQVIKEFQDALVVFRTLMSKVDTAFDYSHKPSDTLEALIEMEDEVTKRVQINKELGDELTELSAKINSMRDINKDLEAIAKENDGFIQERMFYKKSFARVQNAHRTLEARLNLPDQSGSAQLPRPGQPRVTIYHEVVEKVFSTATHWNSG